MNNMFNLLTVVLVLGVEHFEVRLCCPCIYIYILINFTCDWLQLS